LPQRLIIFLLIKEQCCKPQTRKLTKFADRTVMKGSGLYLWAAAITVLAVTLAHGVSPFPYDDYQTPIMPLMAVVVSAVLWQRLDSSLAQKFVGKAPLLLCIATVMLAMSSPLLMDWVMIRKDRFWFEKKERPDIMVLRDLGKSAGDALRSHGHPLVLFTQDAYFAVEAGCDVPKGLEMGPFSLFPDLSDEDARRFHVHNVNTLKQLIADSTNAVIAITSGYSFSVACPGTQPLPKEIREDIFKTLEKYYDLRASVPNVGQGHTEVKVWYRKLDVMSAQ